MSGTFSAPPSAANTSSGDTNAAESPLKSARVSPDVTPGIACPMLVTANTDRSTSVVEVLSTSEEPEIVPKAIPMVETTPKFVAVVHPAEQQVSDFNAQPAASVPVQQFSISSSPEQSASDAILISVHSSGSEQAAVPLNDGEVAVSQSPIRSMSPLAPVSPPHRADSLTPISKASSQSVLESSEEDEINLKEAKLELARALAESARARVELLETKARSLLDSRSSTRSRPPTVAEMEADGADIPTEAPGGGRQTGVRTRPLESQSNLAKLDLTDPLESCRPPAVQQWNDYNARPIGPSSSSAQVVFPVPFSPSPIFYNQQIFAPVNAMSVQGAAENVSIFGGGQAPRSVSHDVGMAVQDSINDAKTELRCCSVAGVA